MIIFFRWYTEHYDFDADDNFSLLSGITHDPVIRDIVTPLLVGGQLIIPTSDDLSSPSNLSNFLIDNQVSVVHFTPPMGKILFELSSVELSHGSVRYLHFGGDRLSLDLVEKCLIRVPGVKISNFYGATETPQVMLYNDITLDKIDRYRKAGLATAPVGVSIPGVKVHLEKENGKECANGEEGQVVIESQYLSLGYLSNEKERLAEDCNLEQSANVYKTGDFGRKLKSGEIDCLGRRDRQVKIRGYRIEPVEIENIIRRIDLIEDVVVQKNSESDELDAFVVCGSDSPDLLRINTHLREYLPSYVQIRNLFKIDKIRLTSNNKVDFEYLEKCRSKEKKGAASCEVMTGREQGHADTVRVVVEIFQQTLGIAEIDPEANLLELGCDSLKSFELVENINN